MKLIRCRKCEDVVRLIDTKWRTCECGKSGGQYNEDSVTATVGGDCDVVGLSNLFFDNKYRKLSDEEKEEYKKEINHHSCEVWFGELEGDKQIHRIKSSKGPRLKMDIDYIGKACVITFKDNRDYKVNLKGNKKPKKLIIPDANMKPSFKKDKIKESMEKKELRKLIRESLSESSEAPYITKEVSLDVYGFNDMIGDDDTFDKSYAEIHWDIDFEKRSWGIKSESIKIKKLILDINIYREDSGETEEVRKEFNDLYVFDGGRIEDFKLEITKTADTGHIFPTVVAIDGNHKTIEIEFDYL